MLKAVNIVCAACWLLYILYCFYTAGNHCSLPVKDAAYLIIGAGMVLLTGYAVSKKIRIPQIMLGIFLLTGWGVTILVLQHLHIMMHCEDWVKAGMPEKPF